MAQIPTIEDYTGGWLRGIQVGSNIGAQIAENRREQARMQRLMEQTQFANQIVERDQRLQEASAAREAVIFQQQAESLRQFRTATEDPLFGMMSPAEQATQLRRVPLAQDQVGRAVQSDLTEIGRQERLDATLRGMEDRRAATKEATDIRQQLRTDAGFDRLQTQLTANKEAADQAQKASMDRTRFTQDEISKRSGAKEKSKGDEFPFGSPASIYDQLLRSKEAGVTSGKISDGSFVESDFGGILGMFKAQPIDKLIGEVAPKVPPAVKRKIEKKVAADTEDPEVVEEETRMDVVQESGLPKGLIKGGNIDLKNRPVVKNPDGTVSTVRTISVGFPEGEVLIPTVVNGKVVSEEEAIAHYKKTKEHLGIFDTPENATIYAEQLHNDQAKSVGSSERQKALDAIKRGAPEAAVRKRFKETTGEDL